MCFETCRRRQKSNQNIDLKSVQLIGLWCIIVNCVVGLSHELGDRGSIVRCPGGARDFSLSQNKQTSIRAHSIVLLNGYSRYFSGGRAAWCEAKRSPPSIAEVTNEWNYTSTSWCAFTQCAGTTVTFTLPVLGYVTFTLTHTYV